MTHWLERLNAHPRSRDGLIATFWLLLGLASLQLGAFRLWGATALFHTSGSVFLVLLLAMSALATQRSSHPLAALGAGTGLAIIDVLFGGSIGVILIFTDLLYAAIKYGSTRSVRAVVWTLCGATALTAVMLLLWEPTDEALLILVIQWALIIMVAALWGWNVRSERLRTQAVMARTHAHSTQQLRQRIAHDLHDLVANQIAVAGLHVEAAKLQIARDHLVAPDVERSLEQAARGTQQADQQLRRMIQVLHAIDDLGTSAETPVGERFDGFLRDMEQAMPGERTLSWSALGAERLRTALLAGDATHARVILRVLSELIANAAKHGQGDVHMRVTSTGPLVVSVENEVGPFPARSPGNGIGISGAFLLLEGSGTTLEAGPAEAGTSWNATLTLQMNGADR